MGAVWFGERENVEEFRGLNIEIYRVLQWVPPICIF